MADLINSTNSVNIIWNTLIINRRIGIGRKIKEFRVCVSIRLFVCVLSQINTKLKCFFFSLGEGRIFESIFFWKLKSNTWQTNVSVDVWGRVWHTVYHYGILNDKKEKKILKDFFYTRFSSKTGVWFSIAFSWLPFFSF